MAKKIAAQGNAQGSAKVVFQGEVVRQEDGDSRNYNNYGNLPVDPDVRKCPVIVSSYNGAVLVKKGLTEGRRLRITVEVIS